MLTIDEKGIIELRNKKIPIKAISKMYNMSSKCIIKIEATGRNKLKTIVSN